ncbi:MAG: HepT-like ribonuclease domain-containing protein [Burkholderiaceae bacterium]
MLGEAATRLMQEHAALVERHPDVPWKQMTGMRNRIAHGYFDIDLDIVWATVQTALPALFRQLESMPGSLDA